MRFQARKYSCGAASVVNALRCYGRRVSEDTVRRVAGTNFDGTDEDGIFLALSYYGFEGIPLSTNRKKIAWEWLKQNLIEGAPVILCVDDWSHWVVVTGVLGDRVILVDPERTSHNKKENGTHVLKKDRLMRRWVTRCSELYGIAVIS